MADLDRYTVFGHPVGHSRSPWIHARFAELTGQRLSYEARDVPPGEFAPALAEFLAAGGKGLNVTVPHKLDALAAAERLTPRARRAGAVNTLAVGPAGLLGDNTDGVGLLRDLQVNLGLSLGHKSILLVGAGGAARGVLPGLLDAAPREVVIANRHAARAVGLAAEFAADGRVSGASLDAVHGPFDLILNATSASLADEVPELPADVVRPGTFFYDLAYGGAPTSFMRWASRHGAERVADGTGMLVEQAAVAFELWRGVRPPTAPVLADLRQLQSGCP